MSKTSRLGAAKTIQPVVVAAGGLALDSSVVYLVNQALDDANDWWIRVTGKGFSIGPVWHGRTWRRYPAGDDQDKQINFALGVLGDLYWPRSPWQAYLIVVKGGGGLAGQVPLDVRGGSALILLGDMFIDALSRPVAIVGRESRDGQIGALCHELGHLVLGSPHDETDLRSVMGAEYEMWPGVGLTGDELVRADMSGWLF